MTLFIGCNSTTSGIDNYIEAHPTFFDLRHGDITRNLWIRDPKNLLMVHETLKKIGYRNLIDNDLLTQNPFIEQGIYINRSLRQILDSLQITYNLDTIQEQYYREFWQRRKKEHNDSVVSVIVKEINESFQKTITPTFNIDLVNDTLFTLVFTEFRNDTLNSIVATDNFIRLKRLGFHQSAYNLLYGTTRYENIKWNKDSLKQTLTISKHFIYPWYVDNTGP